MLIYDGRLLGVKVLEPSGNFKRRSYFLNLLTEDGETFQVSADEGAYELAAALPQLATVRARLRLRETKTERGGRAYKLAAYEVEEGADG